MRRLSVALLLVVLSASGCAYRNGRPQPSGLHVFQASGWDSGLALGRAEEFARSLGEDGRLAGTQMDCTSYFLKPAGMVTAGLGAAKAFEENSAGVGIALLVAAAAIFMLPNCYATLTYEEIATAEEETPRAAAPPGQALDEE